MPSLLFWSSNPTTEEEESCFPALTYQERLIGFCVCFALGTIIQFLSFGSIFGVLVGSPTKFAITYTLGNILSISGTTFLMGPMSQLKSMTDKTRLYTTIVFLVAMVMTLLSAFVFHKAILVLIFLIIQIGAYIWYVASYIPFARSCLKSTLEKCFTSA